MKTLVFIELGIILFCVIIRFIYKAYIKHKDKNKVKKVLRYLNKTGNVDVEKLQMILGVDKNEDKGTNKE
ncbi:hypothetical protein [uncultured Clostridium sp.]|uniref:hypothetical protein n=1 Tax=uncultured Clostridium sp. TaxID=59620 RepID=UPI0026EF587D|nr:hypothetical protein [uncultured Clostridium sp.]